VITRDFITRLFPWCHLSTVPPLIVSVFQYYSVSELFSALCAPFTTCSEQTASRAMHFSAAVIPTRLPRHPFFLLQFSYRSSFSSSFLSTSLKASSARCSRTERQTCPKSFFCSPPQQPWSAIPSRQISTCFSRHISVSPLHCLTVRRSSATGVFSPIP